MEKKKKKRPKVNNHIQMYGSGDVKKSSDDKLPSSRSSSKP